MKHLLTCAAAAALLSGCAPMDRQARDQAALAAARPVGEPVDCLNIANIDYTRVRSDSVIDFYMRGGRVYRNTIPNGCPGLGFDERFSYKPAGSQLCSVDIITVFNSTGMRGPSCGLGAFQPIETRLR